MKGAPLVDNPGDYINGRFVLGPENQCIRILSPADDQDLVSQHRVSMSHVEHACDVARQAWPAWRRKHASERAALLRRYQEKLRSYQSDMVDVLCREIAKPHWEATGEVAAMIAKVDTLLDEGAQWTQLQHLSDLPGDIRYPPLGVIGILGPFNFPGHLPNGQIVAALALGNTLVFKPSDKAPSMGYWIARCIHEAGFPAGVFSMLQGDSTLAAALLAQPQLDAVLFTGSAEVGHRIAQEQHQRFPSRLVALELGGKNAAIMLEDCHLEHALRHVAFGALATAGQRCTATSRLFVHRTRLDESVERLQSIWQGVRIGHPLDEGVFMGPLINDQTATRWQQATQKAASQGYQALQSAQRHRVPGYSGHYVKPSLHLAPHSTHAVAGYTDDELFAPDLAIYPFDDLEEAVHATNQSHFGLSAAVFTSSREHFEYAADGLRVGVLHWNRGTAGASGRLPFGGIKQSGNHHPAGICVGALCTYAQGVLLDKEAQPPSLPSWPGLV